MVAIDESLTGDAQAKVLDFARPNTALYVGGMEEVLVALDAKTGKEVWTTTVGDNKAGYYTSIAPMIADGKVLLGASGRAAITAIKPLFDREREAQARQLGLSGEVTDAAHELARPARAPTRRRRLFVKPLGRHGRAWAVIHGSGWPGRGSGCIASPAIFRGFSVPCGRARPRRPRARCR